MAAFANSSESTLAYIAETTPGTTPTSPVFRRLRFTDETITPDTQETQSNEVRPSRNVADLITTGRTVEGGFDYELSYGSFDDLIAGAIGGAWTTNVTKGGVLDPYFTFESSIATDPVNYFRFPGCSITNWTATITARQPITGTFSVRGRSVSRGTSILAGATYTATNTNPIMTASGVAGITVGGVAGTLVFQDLSFQVANNIVDLEQVGSLDLADTIYGQRAVTGTMTAYFADPALFDVANDPDSESSLSFDISDGDNAYTLLFPRIKIRGPQRQIGGNNNAVRINARWQALHHGATDSEIQITRIPVA